MKNRGEELEAGEDAETTVSSGRRRNSDSDKCKSYHPGQPVTTRTIVALYLVVTVTPIIHIAQVRKTTALMRRMEILMRMRKLTSML